jgi:hypothetical protein
MNSEPTLSNSQTDWQRLDTMSDDHVVCVSVIAVLP